jgi:dephospho-CoA kinase
MNIMLVGKMGAGKTEAARYLGERWGAVTFHRARLMHAICHALVDGADDLDLLLERLFPGDSSTVDDLRSKLVTHVIGYVPDERRQRQLYQDVVKIVQDYNPLAFEIELESRMQVARSHVGEGKMLVIEDMYTLPAFEYFAARGFQSIRITAPLSLARERIKQRDGFLPIEGTFDHETEADLDRMPCAVTIVNDGSLQALGRKIDQALIELGAAHAQKA